MAFSVTPSSGAAPYTLTASFTNSKSVTGSTYIGELRGSSSSTGCPAAGTGMVNDVVGVAELLANGVYVSPVPSIGENSCRTFTFYIKDANGVVVSQASANVNNLA